MNAVEFEAVIGLEVHIQLLTLSKAFSSDSTTFGSLPNTQVSPVTLGHPGTLPVLNERVVEYAVKLGMACNCTINKKIHFARKNYFYPDLPKGYQITQDTTPVCTGGFITIKLKDKKEKKINLTRIHMEEDAGKSIHDQDPFFTLVDLNRAGVPLLEMVSEPDLRSAEEAYQYLSEVRKLVRYLDICDGNMEEGSLRCDANISIRPKGSKELGNKVEVKNMNSLRNVQRAIDFEIKRQTEVLLSGEKVVRETRSFDAVKGITFSMRSKEMADDYRYFPEPDLPPLFLVDDYINTIQSLMPSLPHQLFKKFTEDYNLSEYDAQVLTDNKLVALYFEELSSLSENKKAAANWILGPVKSYINENAIDIDKFPLTPHQLVKLINLVESGKVSFSAASGKIFSEFLFQPEKEPAQIAEELNLVQEDDNEKLLAYISEVIFRYPEKVKEYKAGKTGLVGMFMGEVMKLSKGKADPKVANKLVKEMLDKQ